MSNPTSTYAAAYNGNLSSGTNGDIANNINIQPRENVTVDTPSSTYAAAYNGDLSKNFTGGIPAAAIFQNDSVAPPKQPDPVEVPPEEPPVPKPIVEPTPVEPPQQKAITVQTVKSGDTLSEIADNYNKNRLPNQPFMSVEAVAILNGIENANLIYPGEQLTLTADKATVDSCNVELQKFISSLQSGLTNYKKVDWDSFPSDNGGPLDQAIDNIKAMFVNNVEQTLKDASAYSDWLTQLSTALEDTELWATKVMNNDMTIKSTNGI